MSVKQIAHNVWMCSFGYIHNSCRTTCDRCETSTSKAKAAKTRKQDFATAVRSITSLEQLKTLSGFTDQELTLRIGNVIVTFKVADS